MIKQHINEFRLLLRNFNEKEIINGLENLSIEDLGGITQNDYLEKLLRVNEQFTKELDVNGPYLPIYYLVPKENLFNQNSDSNVLIIQVYAWLIESITNKSSKYSENQKSFYIKKNLSILIQYQMQYGFWEKTNYNYTLNNANKLFVKLSKTEKRLTSLTDLVLKYENKLKEYEMFIKKQIADKNAIEKRWVRSEEVYNNIKNIQLKVSNEFNLLKKEYKSIIERGNEIEDSYKANDKLLNDSIEKFKSKTDAVGKIGEIYNNKYDEVTATLNTIDKRSEKFKELIGVEVGEKLYSKFNSRGNKLYISLILWFIAIIISGGVTYYFISNIVESIDITNAESLSNLSIYKLILSLVKTTPFILFFFYTISQYNKERNLQEEYSFKSAVAFSLYHYIELLDDNKNKDKVLIEAINNIYKTPHLYSKNKDDISILNTAKNIIGSVNDIQKNIVNTVNNNQSKEEKKGN